MSWQQDGRVVDGGGGGEKRDGIETRRCRKRALMNERHSLLRDPAILLLNQFARFWKSVEALSLLFFALLYIAAIHYCKTHFYRDPTSAFFDPDRAYQRSYSVQRQHEAAQYLEGRSSNGSTASNLELEASGKSHDDTRPPTLCVGIVTVKRNGEQYVQATTGSLLQGLTPDERQQIHLAMLIAHTNPNTHPIYHEEWPFAVADSILTYAGSKSDANSSNETLPGSSSDLVHWEETNNYRFKAVYDYTHMLNHCISTGAQWIAMIEDDTVAMQGWYERLLSSLDVLQAEQQPIYSPRNWLYLRLFYTEEFLGWNSEEWPCYLTISISVVAAITTALLLLRHFCCHKSPSISLTLVDHTSKTSKIQPTIISTGKRTSRHPFLRRHQILLTSFLLTPAFIVLYFLAGRLSMRPLSPGLMQMQNYGCCGQGLVFNHVMAPQISAYLTSRGSGFVDSMLDEYADQHDLAKFAIVPSVLQHIGLKSSKADDAGAMAKSRRTVAEKIWNFEFELHDPDHNLEHAYQ